MVLTKCEHGGHEANGGLAICAECGRQCCCSSPDLCSSHRESYCRSTATLNMTTFSILSNTVTSFLSCCLHYEIHFISLSIFLSSLPCDPLCFLLSIFLSSVPCDQLTPAAVFISPHGTVNSCVTSRFFHRVFHHVLQRQYRLRIQNTCSCLRTQDCL